MMGRSAVYRCYSADGASMTDFTFRNPIAEVTEAQLLAVYPPAPADWPASADVALWEGLFMGLKLAVIADKIGLPFEVMKERFLCFKHAATSGVGPLSLKAQTVFLNEARRRAGVAG